jgi:hypothetical protein
MYPDSTPKGLPSPGSRVQTRPVAVRPPAPAPPAVYRPVPRMAGVQFKPAPLVQRALQHTVAPPYRPQPVTKILQAKAPPAQAPLRPAAPPVYRPEAPKLLQSKPVPRPGPIAAAPPVYRPTVQRSPIRPGRPPDPARHLQVAQLKLNALGKHKICGPMASNSETWAGFLEDEGIVDRFFPDDEAVLKELHKQAVEASTLHKSSKGAGTGNTLLKKHTALVAEANDKSVSAGGSPWAVLLEAALDVIVPQPTGTFIKRNAEEAAALVWPTAKLGAVPEAFWKAVLSAAKPKPVAVAPPALPSAVQDVLTHAQERYTAWVTNHETNRGAWHGSDKHGPQPDEYEGVSSPVSAQLEVYLPRNGWRFTKSLSAVEGSSLHKYGGNAKGQDFIYHL